MKRIKRNGHHSMKSMAINFVIPSESTYIKELEEFFNTKMEELPADVKNFLS